jgi:mannose-6-phosphate isomerase-like protein (cupin superfamily)
VKRKKLRFGAGFRVAIGNRRSQAAEMVVKPGKGEGDSRNRHRGADQWLFVEAGTGLAIVNRRRYDLGPARSSSSRRATSTRSATPAAGS